MSTKNRTPTIEAITEDPEDGSRKALRGLDEDSPGETTPRSQQRSHEPGMRANMGRGRSKKAGKQAQKAKAKNTSARKGSLAAPRDFEEPPPVSHRSNDSNGNDDSSSSDEEEEEHIEDPRTALARARLTSPSMVSTMTTHTTATNKSSSSSGSTSTVTRSSVASKRSGLGKRVEIEDAPMSPACPDPPNAFSFTDDHPLQQEADSEDEEEHCSPEEKRTDEEMHHNKGIRWPKPRALMETAHEEPAPGSKPEHISTSSSASSSFHGDDTFSERPAENGSDRSTSPEWSDRGHQDANHAPDQPTEQPTDQHSAKIASQIAAARQRQGSLSSMQQFGTPEMPRGNFQLPHVPPSALNQRPQYQSAQYQPPLATQRPLPRAEKLPITGYELLATKLASHSSTDVGELRIKPIYRKFEALNHRLLLHLQDELVDLEEQLHRLDHADTQSRRMDRHIVPASRRAAEQAGGELQWHKTDVLGRIGFKLAQYSMSHPSHKKS